MKRLLFLIVILVLLTLAIPSVVQANPIVFAPLLIIVPNAPPDLEISIGGIKASREDRPFESYYTVNYLSLKSTDYILRAKTGDKNLEFELGTTTGLLSALFTLDLEKQTLTPGKMLSRDIALISLRVILTLLVEGLVFFLFDHW
jgi:hypothetical protein